ncbi:MAG: NAD(P)H-dependent oxidoreductase subunit E [Coriobacteriia bacterium]|nr:NAD(P)H-dependent oxidoreductase subunit E [Coriobacteriia bacterium]
MDERTRLLEEVLLRHGEDRGGLIAVLQEAQHIFGFLPEEVLDRIAEARGVTPAAVYGVATFYSRFRFEPHGGVVVKICHGTACHVRGAPEVTRAVQEVLGVELGETTEEGDVSLESVACLGCCGLAPVMIVGEKTYGPATPGVARGLVTDLRDEG